VKSISAQILRAFSLVVTDRRWAAPLSAMALGFGVFVGVAIGPSAPGTLAGGPRIIEMSSLGGGESEEEGEGEGAGSGAPLAGPVAGGAEGGAGLGALASPAPFAPAPVGEEPVEEEAQEAPVPTQPSGKIPPAEVEDEEATELKGVVVHANEPAGSYALAIAGGELVPVHARELPAPGAKLTVTASRLANGAFAEEEKPKRSGGKATQAVFRGVVTYADPDPTDPAYTVSGRGASLLVHVPPDPTGAVPTLPATGTYVNVTVGLEPDTTLLQRKIEVEPGEPTTYLDLAGIFREVLPETGQLLFSADGARESEADLTLNVPPTIDTTKLEPGDSYLATATVEEDGTLKLAGIASDEHTKGADDPSLAQGDLKARSSPVVAAASR
jgi:hypothetical protein